MFNFCLQTSNQKHTQEKISTNSGMLGVSASHKLFCTANKPKPLLNSCKKEPNFFSNFSGRSYASTRGKYSSSLKYLIAFFSVNIVSSRKLSTFEAI